jgi:hypothetical protein
MLTEQVDVVVKKFRELNEQPAVVVQLETVTELENVLETSETSELEGYVVNSNTLEVLTA